MQANILNNSDGYVRDAQRNSWAISNFNIVDGNIFICLVYSTMAISFYT